MTTSTQTTAPVKQKTERHGVARWTDHCPLGVGLMELRCGLAILEVIPATYGSGRRPAPTRYRIQTFHDRLTQRLEGITLVKVGRDLQDTGTFYHVDCSFGPVPERDWICDCPDRSYRAGPRQCKHVSALVAALKKINALEDLLKGRLANVARHAAPAVTCADLEAI